MNPDTTRRTSLLTLLSRWLPFLKWSRPTTATLRQDFSAALTGAVVVLPQSLAFASIAGLPPEYGLYAAMVPAIVGALWGSSRHLVSGPTTAISIVVFASISPLAQAGSAHYIALVLTLTLLVGIIQLAMGLAKLGALVNFISHTVILGFTAGAAFLIFASQVGNFLGMAIPRGLPFHETILYAGQHLTESHLWVVAVGIVTLISGIVARRLWPKFPYMILAMAIGSVLAILIGWLIGPQQAAIATMGEVHASLPPLSLPDFSYAAVKSMLFPAFIVAILGLTEAVAISRAIATRSGQRIDSNQEFVGQGLSNLAGSFFSAYPSSGSFNRSGLNYASGAQSGLAAAFSAVFLLVISVFAAPVVAYIPIAAMAAILFIVAYLLVDFHHIGLILRRHPRERIVLLITFFGTLIDLEKGLFLGIMVSLLFFLHKTSQPVIDERAFLHEQLGTPGRKLAAVDDHTPTCPQLAILRLQGAVYFGAVEHVRNHLQAVNEKSVLLLARGITHVDLAGAELLGEEARRRREQGGRLYLAGLPSAVQHMLKRSGQIDDIGADNLITHKSAAFAKAYAELDSEVCRGCSLRVFEECQRTLPNGQARTSD
ncbi:MAG: SulP family inorganic anion transporter [Hylemonella sp.]|nr:SulP family inorganic anion transporter [Hylemonella sp.]